MKSQLSEKADGHMGGAQHGWSLYVSPSLLLLMSNKMKEYLGH